ncbi:MAG TPA: serine protease, partial [Streptosporangiaceae bacterium]
MKPRKPMERLVLILLATLAMCGGSAPGSWSDPPGVDLIVEIEATDNTICHGTPVGIVQILTAAHCVGSGVLKWKGQGQEGGATLLWRDERRDIAMLVTDKPPQWLPVHIAKDKPKALDLLMWRVYLQGYVSVPEAGHYLGLDGDGQIIAAGFFAPGTSGSGLLNARGELVGVVS